ncbi:hypothetical protein Tco_1144737 [Tanacetum coccineum]
MYGKIVAFLGSLPVPLQHNEWIPNYFDNFIKKGDGDGKWHAKVRIVDPYGNVLIKVLNNMGCGDAIEDMLAIKVYEMGGDEKIFISEAWRLTDEELMSKKVIKFRLGGRGHRLTILEFARRLGLYFNDEIQDEGFETYFLGGLKNYDNFNVNQYWIAKRAYLLTGEMLDGLSALVYCRPLDTTTLRELIGSNGRLIAEEPAPGDPRVAAPRRPRHSIFDLYDRMGRMEIQQGELERMSRRLSYHFNR